MGTPDGWREERRQWEWPADGGRSGGNGNSRRKNIDNYMRNVSLNRQSNCRNSIIYTLVGHVLVYVIRYENHSIMSV